MAEKIVNLAKWKGDPDTEVVALAERLLEWAKSGRIVGLAYVSIRADHVVGTGWDMKARVNAHSLLGGAAVLQHRLADAVMNNDEAEPLPIDDIPE